MISRFTKLFRVAEMMAWSLCQLLASSSGVDSHACLLRSRRFQSNQALGMIRLDSWLKLLSRLRQAIPRFLPTDPTALNLTMLPRQAQVISYTLLKNK
jgi:hypothetical protein